MKMRIAPPYSVVILSDEELGEVPETIDGGAIAVTSTAIAIGCLSEADGETEFTLGPRAEVSRTDAPVHQSAIRTPTRRVVIRSVLGQRLLEVPVLRESTHVAIWTNHPTEPDVVVIGVE